MKKELNLPDKKSSELAEETGIHIGDGSMNFYKVKNQLKGSYTCSFNASDDKEYSEFFKILFEKIYRIKPSNESIRNNTLMIKYCRNELIKFKKKIGLPLGPKKDITMPKWVLNNSEFYRACIRGIMDTDGSIKFQNKYRERHYYPVFAITSKSEQLIKQISTLLKKENITNCVQLEDRIRRKTRTKVWKVQISGKNNLFRYIKLFGFSNQKHIEKISIWKEFGFCPPYLNYETRKKILRGDISPHRFYNAADGI